MNYEEIIWNYLDGHYSAYEFQQLRSKINDPEFEEQLSALSAIHNQLNIAVVKRAPAELIKNVLKQTKPNSFLAILNEYKALLLFLSFLIAVLVLSIFVPSKPSLLLSLVREKLPINPVQFDFDPSFLALLSPYLICLLIIPAFYFIDKLVARRFERVSIGLFSF